MLIEIIFNVFAHCICIILRLHTKGSSSVDLSALVALSRSNHAHEQQMKEFFASSYERQRGILTLDPAYVVTWQNSVECIRLLMAAISRLGNELLIIREVDN